jgi:hypothetical protein
VCVLCGCGCVCSVCVCVNDNRVCASCTVCGYSCQWQVQECSALSDTICVPFLCFSSLSFSLSLCVLDCLGKLRRIMLIAHVTLIRRTEPNPRQARKNVHLICATLHLVCVNPHLVCKPSHLFLFLFLCGLVQWFSVTSATWETTVRNPVLRGVFSGVAGNLGYVTIRAPA